MAIRMMRTVRGTQTLRRRKGMSVWKIIPFNAFDPPASYYFVTDEALVRDAKLKRTSKLANLNFRASKSLCLLID